MSLPIGLASQLLELLGGGHIAGSKMKHALIADMVDSGVLTVQVQGRSKQTIRLRDATALAQYLQNHHGIADLAAYVDGIRRGDLSRGEAVQLASDSKLRTARSFKGFLVNCLAPLDCLLHGSDYRLAPTEGTFTFVYDYEGFVPPPDVTIVGIENPSNFRHVQRQASLFAGLQPLFVSRYPQSRDLVRWLEGIPQPYLHFGDFDFAGLNIYWNEYKRHLGDRASFFVPDAVEELLAQYGNRDLYLRQQLSFATADVSEASVLRLIGWIERHGKGLEQEVFLSH